LTTLCIVWGGRILAPTPDSWWQHGHVTLNGRKTGVPSALVSAGDVVSIRPESMRRPISKCCVENMDDRQVPRWLNLDTCVIISGKIVNLPAREDIDVSIERAA
jgi:small subunit ribosomal protein S4